MCVPPHSYPMLYPAKIPPPVWPQFSELSAFRATRMLRNPMASGLERRQENEVPSLLIPKSVMGSDKP